MFSQSPKKTRGKRDLSQSRVVIGVSVGSNSFEGQNLEQLLKTAAYAQDVAIEICCTLQRHTRKIFHPELDEEVLTVLAREEGNKWYERNKGMICSILGTKFRDKPGRWDIWLNHRNYGATKAEIEGLFQTDSVFINAMQLSVQEVKTRFLKQIHEDPDKGDMLKRYFKIPKEMVIDNHEAAIKFIEHQGYLYLTEEAGIVMKLWLERGYHGIIYPSKITPVLNAAYERFAQSYQHANLLQWMTIRLKCDKAVKGDANYGYLISQFRSFTPEPHDPISVFSASGNTFNSGITQTPMRDIMAKTIQQHILSCVLMLPSQQQSSFVLELINYISSLPAMITPQDRQAMLKDTALEVEHVVNGNL